MERDGRRTRDPRSKNCRDLRCRPPSHQKWRKSQKTPTSPNIRKSTSMNLSPPYKTLGRWLQSYQGDSIITSTITKWSETCDNLIENPHFTDGWYLPAFYPIYSHQSWTVIELFFNTSKAVYPEHTILWNKQLQLAKAMFSSWEPTYFGTCANKRVPFPKCLWYHKYHYVCVYKQSQQWESYFRNTPFHVWGKL